ncbi:protein-L-isoaspartate O-methyltransferase [Mesorhizobium sp. LHD-90]|uniref:protein-L-isoaspartate O-methyltransferase family protein n=1 Tax=Mesorhizobium sp. LHD-90 TaxID=3071414 RepID=UPI0027E062D9|nr:protein-L-isoaspartate O-methyltransferase [Mesorhizobium sp. LHD-90]MDQ6437913.1 protein-L-isoaspartate O-methyltransferase [Mesorhizobium sp. LHD-90]
MEADYAQRRIRMVDGQVRTTDVTSAALLDAMLAVPREAFVAAGRRDLAYIDEDVEIAPAAGGNPPRYLMEPSPFAKLAQLAEIAPADFVLDVGCGTGYSSAVLSRLASSVVALESDGILADIAAGNLAALGCDNVAVVKGPLQEGYAAEAPYDVIFLGGSVETLPDALVAQLKEGGRLVAVEGGGNAGKAKLYSKWNGVVTGRSAFNAAIKPLPGFERAYTFQF